MAIKKRTKLSYSNAVMLVSLLCVALASSWLINVAKFVDCDFKSDYKCEVVHGVGIVLVPASIITVWFESDEE